MIYNSCCWQAGSSHMKGLKMVLRIGGEGKREIWVHVSDGRMCAMSAMSAVCAVCAVCALSGGNVYEWGVRVWGVWGVYGAGGGGRRARLPHPSSPLHTSTSPDTPDRPHHQAVDKPSRIVLIEQQRAIQTVHTHPRRRADRCP